MRGFAFSLLFALFVRSVREDTPRHDYHGCIRLIRDLVTRIEAKAGRTGTVGIGIPGSLEPRSRLGKGASSTWLLGQPVEKDLRDALGREIRVENDADCLAASEAGAIGLRLAPQPRGVSTNSLLRRRSG